jgi:DNA-directed RNA polymerase subunit RPC12/RpoP
MVCARCGMEMKRDDDEHTWTCRYCGYEINDGDE